MQNCHGNLKISIILFIDSFYGYFGKKKDCPLIYNHMNLTETDIVNAFFNSSVDLNDLRVVPCSCERKREKIRLID